jgi:2-polyprenyl-3-methyl-5-hydroxy-6-metoxy-1,4-benzoquinol methylase
MGIYNRSKMKDLNQVEAEIYAYQGGLVRGRGPEETERLHRRKLKWYCDRFQSLLPSDKSAKILDVPCGEGNILYFLKELGYSDVHGFDLDECRVEVAQQIGSNAQVKDAFVTRTLVCLLFLLCFQQKSSCRLVPLCMADCSKAEC